MPLPVANSVRAQIQELRASGLSERAIASRVCLSKTAVHGVLAHVAPPEPADAIPAVEIPATDAEVLVELRRAYAEASDLARRARASNDAARAAAWQRIALQTAAEIRKASSAAEDPDDYEGVPGEAIRLAAQRGKEHLTDALKRELESREAWPRCATCGQRVRP